MFIVSKAVKMGKKVMNDSLYRNSIFLIGSTAVMSLFGFFFWMIAARLYDAGDIGLATAIISVVGLITGFSVLGFNVGLIRFLPKSRDPSRKINTCMTLVALVSVVVASIYIMFMGRFSPDLMFIRDSLLMSLILILFVIVASLNTLIDSVYTAFRDTKFILIKNSIFSVLKIGGLFLLVSFGAFGIFASHMVALGIGLFVVLLVLMKKYKYRPRFVVSDSILKKIGKYSFGNYAAGFIGGLPLMVLPLLILNKLGAEQVAYYYMAMMIAGLLFVIPGATANSLFAEGSYSEKDLKKLIWKAVRIISVLLIPAILLIFFFGDLILGMFGAEYVENGFGLLKILAVSGVFVGVNSVFGSLLKVRKKINVLLGMSFLGPIFILGGSYTAIRMGEKLISVGYVWLASVILFMFIHILINKNIFKNNQI